MTQKRKILIFGKNEENCMNLKYALEKDYVVHVQNIEQAISCNFESVGAILLNLDFPNIQDLKVLEKLQSYKPSMNIPMIVLADCGELALERKVYDLGATDFIKEPYDSYILKQKIANLIKVTYLTKKDDFQEKDILTNLWNKQIFFNKVNQLIINTDICYDIICFDIERFKLINDFFGTDMGDLVLKYIAEVLEKNALQYRGICTRLDSDIFATCIPRIANVKHQFIINIANSIEDFSLGFSINIKFGIYKIEDPTVPIRAMCDRAKLAKQSIKGKYGEVYAYYDKSLREKIVEEQEIINDMSVGLVNGHFKVYYQPKYNLSTGSIIGAEALVRWAHPKKGMIVPYRFIPLFEKNGFITTLDIYIWEKVCSYIKNRIDQGLKVVPISVNVSRVDIYNPNLVEILQKLIVKYEISPELLELEITETAYTENPKQMIEIIKKLKSKGFKISMDDFGSGYSSLNMLSEIAVDIIKLDMKFLQNNDIDGKNGNILNFVVNLAKWMNVPVIAEGIETKEQAEYLKSIGCFNGQGYFFSKPINEEQFTKLLEVSLFNKEKQQQDDLFKFINIKDIWNPSSHFNIIFNNYIGALAMYEYSNDELMFLRGNDEYYQLVNWKDCYNSEISHNILKFLHSKDRTEFIKTLDSLAINCNNVTSETRWVFYKEKITWLKQEIKVIYKHNSKTIFLCHLENITSQKEHEEKLVEQNNKLKKLYNYEKKEMQYLQFAYSRVTCGIIRFTPTLKNNLISMNNESFKIFGFKNEQDFIKECKGNLLKVIPAKERRKLLKTISNYLSDNCQDFFVVKAIKKDKRFVWIKGYVVKEKYEGEYACWNVFFTDITKQLRKQRQLDILKEQFLVYKNHSNSIAFRYHKRKGSVTFVTTDEENNPQMLPINNFSHRIMESGIILEEYKERVKNFFELIQSGILPEKIQIKVRDCTRELSWYEISLFEPDGWNKELDEVICIFKNITKEKNQELVLIKQAKRDELTGLFNRKALQVHLTTRLPKVVEQGQLLAFLMIDLDGFKEVNDQYGHVSGDQALIAVSAIFNKEIAQGDIVARVGGDEFVVVLESITCKQDAIDYGNRICSSIERYKKEFDFTLSCSVGISIAPNHGMEFQDLYKKADTALYNAKRLGKNMCCIYE